MAGHRTLTAAILVRPQVPEPNIWRRTLVRDIEIVKIYDSGKWENSEILAKHIGCTSSQVRCALRRHGRRLPKAARKHGRRLMDWERVAIREAYLSGEKIEAVALEFGCSVSTVFRHGTDASSG
jgi:hypothetical protein